MVPVIRKNTYLAISIVDHVYTVNNVTFKNLTSTPISWYYVAR